MCLTILAVAAIALPALSSAADFSGHWRYFERDAIEIAPRTYDHSADFIFWQRGDRVYGTWSESGNRGSHGCVKGIVTGRSLQAQVCLQEGSFGSEGGAVCPSYSQARDRFDLSRKSVVWYRYNEPAHKWEKYLTLAKRNSISRATWPKECGADHPAS
ncbi:MAG: hypothetical protein ABI580_04185 [Burkholderiaceae bacterium]